MNYVMLKDVCTINMGQSPASNSYNDNGDGVPFFQGNADFGERYPVTRKWCSAPTKIAAPEDILISVRAPIGAMNYAKEECCIGRGLAALTPDKSKVSPEFIFWLLKGKNAELNSKGTGSTFKAIGRKVLEETMVPDVPLEKQLEYSEILERVYDVIQARKEELLKLDELIKARFIELFGDPSTNPYGWVQTTVGDVCSSIVRGPFGSALKKDFFVEPSSSTYKVYEQKHAIQKNATIGNYYITKEKYMELKRFECFPGDILMSCSGTMGEFYQLPSKCERGIINQALCKFTLNDKILPICFLTYMKETINNLETKGSGIKNIAAVSYVKEMPINLPPKNIQKQFESFVKQVDKSKEIIQKKIDIYQELFNKLMQEYFG